MDKDAITIYLANAMGDFNDSSLVVEIKHSSRAKSVYNTSPFSIHTNTWQHIAVSYDGVSEVKIFINGEEEELNIINPASGGIKDNAEEGLLIGNSNTFSMGSYQGIIDEIRLWNTALDQNWIDNHMMHYLTGYEDGLIGYWTLNEGDGGVSEDKSANTNNGILSGSVWCQGVNLYSPVMVSEQLPDFNDLNISPNPFVEQTQITFNLKKEQHTQIAIYDLNGRKICCLINQNLGIGTHNLNWPGCDETGKEVSNGVYVLRVLTGNNRLVSMLVKR